MSQNARDRILGRVREANRDREPIPHPGPLPASAEPPALSGGGHQVPSDDGSRADPIEAFEARLSAAGGEVVTIPSPLFNDQPVLTEYLEGIAQEMNMVITGVDWKNALGSLIQVHVSGFSLAKDLAFSPANKYSYYPSKETFTYGYSADAPTIVPDKITPSAGGATIDELIGKIDDALLPGEEDVDTVG